MHWFHLPTDVQRIVWDFAGSLERDATRRRRFLGLEIKCWSLVRGYTLTPSALKRHYRHVGRHALHDSLYDAWAQSRQLPRVC